VAAPTEVARALARGNEEPTGGTCFFCGDDLDGDYFCYGCKEYICDTCAGSDVCAEADLCLPMRSHNIYDHEELKLEAEEILSTQPDYGDEPPDVPDTYEEP